MDAAAHVEVTDNRHFSGPARLHQIIENPIDDGLVKGSLIAIRPQLEL